MAAKRCISEGGQNLIMLLIWSVTLLIIALFCPNTIRVLGRYEPALGVVPHSTQMGLGALSNGTPQSIGPLWCRSWWQLGFFPSVARASSCIGNSKGPRLKTFYGEFAEKVRETVLVSVSAPAPAPAFGGAQSASAYMPGFGLFEFVESAGAPGLLEKLHAPLIQRITRQLFESSTGCEATAGCRWPSKFLLQTSGGPSRNSYRDFVLTSDDNP